MWQIASSASPPLPPPPLSWLTQEKSNLCDRQLYEAILGPGKNKWTLCTFVCIPFQPRYNDELPCLRKMYPDHCRTEDNNDSDDEWDGWRRKKRSTEGKHWQDYEGFGNMGSFENCTCKWGFLRNANVTLRKPVMFLDFTIKHLFKLPFITFFELSKI